MQKTQNSTCIQRIKTQDFALQARMAAHREAGRDCSAPPNTASGTSRIIDSLTRAYLLVCEAANPGGLRKPTEQTMSISSILRTATLALTLVAAMGTMGTAFAASRIQEQQAANSNSGVYDSPNFVVAPTDIHP
jgi:hypothetical protein